MSRNMRRLVAETVLVLAASACGESRYMTMGLDPLASGGLPKLQMAGDSIRVYAAEWTHGMESSEPTLPSSDQAPGEYTWSSSNPAIVEVRAGWLVSHAPGAATITVRSTHASLAQGVTVCAAGSLLRITPRDPVLNQLDILNVSFALRQPDGNECAKVDFAAFGPSPWIANAPLEPVFNQTGRWRAVRSGVTWYVAESYFAPRHYKDSIQVTVR